MTGHPRGRVRAGLSVAGGLAAVTMALAVAAGASTGGQGKARPSPTPPSPTAVPSFAPPTAAPGAGVVSGRVAVSPITIFAELSQGAAKAGQRVQVRITVTNQARAEVANVTVTLLATPQGVALRPIQGREIRRIAGGAQASVAWSACASTPGMYSFIASAAVGGMVVTSSPVQLIVSPGRSC